MKKGLIIFLLAFACITFGITAALIVINNNANNAISNIHKDLQVDYSLGITDLTMKYMRNNLKTTEITHAEGGKVWLSQYSSPDRLSITYYSIDGLKDKAIERKINETIKEYAFSLLPDVEADSRQVSCYVVGNFANILSLNFSSFWYNKTDADYDYHYGKGGGITLDLTTGNIIELKDCFVDNANINVIVSNAIYKSSAWDEKYMWGEWDEETQTLPPVDRSDLEEKAFSAMHEINKGNYYFTVSEYSININTDNAWANIDYEDYHDQIAIFKRYATKESIFDGTHDKGEEVYFGLSFASDKIHEFSDNLIIIEDLFYEDWQEKDEIKRMIDARIASEKSFANKNNDTVILEAITNNDYNWDFYYETSSDYYNRTNNYNLVARGLTILRAEMPRKYYEDNAMRDDFFKILRTGFNSMSGEVSYQLTDYFKELDENGVLSSLTIATNGKIYTHGEWNGNQTIYTLLAQDFDKLESSSKLLTVEDISSLDSDALNKAYNQLFAKHGHDFASKELKDYFLGFLWYTPEPGKKVSVEELNNIEQKNLELISFRINELKK